MKLTKAVDADHYIRLAYEQANRSPDPSTQNGSVIITAEGEIAGYGLNDFPPGVLSKPERLISPEKYSWIEHAERWATYDAAKRGCCTDGATMFVPWAACSDCARAIVCSGHKLVVVHKPMMDLTTDRWKVSIAKAMEILAESGVPVEYCDSKIGGFSLRFDYKTWEP